MDSHGTEFEAQREDQDAGCHVVAAVEKVAGMTWANGRNRIGFLIEWYNRLMNTPDPEFIDPSQVRPGPIRNESLPPELLEYVQAVYDVIGPYLETTLEQFEISLMRDASPEEEVAIWCSITAAWIAYHEQHLGDELLPDEDEKKLIAALISISTGVEDLAVLGVPPDVGRKLLTCYDELGEE
jgi:hypothetical protein